MNTLGVCFSEDWALGVIGGYGSLLVSLTEDKQPAINE